MTSALLNLPLPLSSPLPADLQAAGISVLGSFERHKMVREVLRQGPDLVIFEEAHPDEALFQSIEMVASTCPVPVLVFTTDRDAEKIARAVQAGVHAYVVGGYAFERLRPLIHLAQARFAREAALHTQLLEVSSRLEERKAVDRAKGILMRARQVSDDDAFKILRTASMHSNQRLGAVSEHIIRSARFAQDVNRSGQLRMLSQRLVKLALLQLAGVQRADVRQRLADSMGRVDANLAALGKSLSRPNFGDLLDETVRIWSELKRALEQELSPGRISAVDAVAERLLEQAERLTSSLESAGAAPPLHVLNVAGRQRMLSQRFAKCALMVVLAGETAAPQASACMDESRRAFEAAQGYLQGIPLTSKEIQAALQRAAGSWQQMLAGAGRARDSAATLRAEGLAPLAVASEELLETFEQLSAQYEQSMQMLVG